MTVASTSRGSVAAGPRGVVTAAALGITAAGVVRGGGFFTPDLVAIPLFLCIAALFPPRAMSRADIRLVVALVLFAGFWQWRGFDTGLGARAASLSAAAIAFGAAFVIARRCRTPRERLIVMRVSVGVGLGVAIFSLGRWAAHQAPWGLPFDGIWRLSGPFAYPNAAGLFFALALVANLARNDRTWLDRATSAAVLFGALAATASRGALLALFAGVVVMGLGRFGANTRRRRVVLACGVTAALLVSFYVALVTFGVTGATRSGNASASIDDRVAEWSAAARQGRSKLALGVGPDRDLFIHNFRGDAIARYAHNEALQVFAGGGLVGVALLGLVVAAAIAMARDEDRPRGRLAAASLLVLVIGGLVDFSFHFVGLLAYAGWLVGTDEELPTG